MQATGGWGDTDEAKRVTNSSEGTRIVKGEGINGFTIAIYGQTHITQDLQPYSLLKYARMFRDLQGLGPIIIVLNKHSLHRISHLQ